MTIEPKNGVCDYKTIYVVTTYTSGTELRGLPVVFGTYTTALEARQALADDGFTNGEFGWRKDNYTDASIMEKVVYSNHRPDLTADIVKAADELADAVSVVIEDATQGDLSAPSEVDASYNALITYEQAKEKLT